LPVISNLSRDIPVVVPVAALEQHGQHMPERAKRSVALNRVQA